MTEQQQTETPVMTEAQTRTAMKDPDHLKKWLAKTGRTFMVFKSVDLVDALVFPAGHQILQQMIHHYGEQRSVQASEIVTKDGAVHLAKDELLQPGETLEAIEFLLLHFVDMEKRRLQPLFPEHTELTRDMMARDTLGKALESLVTKLKLNA